MDEVKAQPASPVPSPTPPAQAPTPVYEVRSSNLMQRGLVSLFCSNIPPVQDTDVYQDPAPQAASENGEQLYEAEPSPQPPAQQEALYQNPDDYQADGGGEGLHTTTTASIQNRS